MIKLRWTHITKTLADAYNTNAYPHIIRTHKIRFYYVDAHSIHLCMIWYIVIGMICKPFGRLRTEGDRNVLNPIRKT
jgi:hypothetical protein